MEKNEVLKYTEKVKKNGPTEMKTPSNLQIIIDAFIFM